MTRARSVPDLRLLPPVLAGWAAARLGLTHPPAETLAAAAALAVVGAALLCRGRILVPVGATLLVAAALACSAALHLYALRLGPVSALADQRGRASVRATVTGDPKPVKGLILLPIRIDEFSDRGPGDGTAPGPAVGVRSPATVLAHPRSPDDLARWTTLLPSMGIELSGRFVPPKDPASGDAATLLAARAPRVLGGPSPVQRWAGALRTDLRRAVAGLPAEPSGVLPALTLGDASAVPPPTAADLKTAGLSYLIVVSGENN